MHDMAVPYLLGKRSRGGGLSVGPNLSVWCRHGISLSEIRFSLMDSVSGVGVIDKGVLILRALTRAPLDLAALQDETGLPRATAHRLAVALELHGLVRRDPQGRFCLGFELIRLGRAAEDQFPLADLARPILTSLRDATGESVQLYVPEGDSRRCVVSLESTHGLRWIVPQGALLPMDRGSAGRVLQGDESAESVEER